MLKEDESVESLWTVTDVVKYLVMSESWVYHRVETGLLPCVRVGGRLRVVPADVRAAFGIA